MQIQIAAQGRRRILADNKEMANVEMANVVRPIKGPPKLKLGERGGYCKYTNNHIKREHDKGMTVNNIS